MNSRPVSLICVYLAFVCLTGSVLSRTQNQQPVADRNAGSISGRVTVDGKPKAGLVVELLTTITNGPRRSIAKVTTNKTGKYVLTNIPSGTYDVSPSAPALVVPIQGQSGQSGKIVTIETDEAVKGIDFDLVTRGSVSGRVHAVSGEGIKGQTVELILLSEN